MDLVEAFAAKFGVTRERLSRLSLRQFIAIVKERASAKGGVMVLCAFCRGTGQNHAHAHLDCGPCGGTGHARCPACMSKPAVRGDNGSVLCVECRRDGAMVDAMVVAIGEADTADAVGGAKC